MKKIILITGGSRGIGAAVAKQAAEHGYAVCISYLHNQAAAEAVVAAIRLNSGEAMAVQADVALESDVVRLFNQVDAAYGPLTALVNNAGVLAGQARVDEMDSARIQRIFATKAV